MPKNIDDVILPGGNRKKSIRNIPIPEGRRKTDQRYIVPSHTDPVAPVAEKVKKGPTFPTIPPMPPLTKPPVENNEEPFSYPPHRFERKSRSRKGTWLTLGALVVAIVFVTLSMFSGATLSYLPKSAALTFNNESFIASKTGEDTLLYSVVKLSGEKSASVAATGEEQVSRKASGTIVIYNNASTEPQRLIENTRFESPTGKIYRIAQAVTVPGKRGETPGSIEVQVFADVPGVEYNSDPTDFTVPGLKGTPRFSTIYARSKTAITGGFVGMEKSVGAAELAAARTSLQEGLSGELIAKAQAEVPSDFILLPNLSSVTFEDLPQTAGEAGNVMVNLRGNLYGVMFKRSDLARELSARKVPLTKDAVLDLQSFDTLQITLNSTTTPDILTLDELNLRVNGTSTLLWRSDEVALKADLVGRKKGELSTILNNYPTIESADVTVRPFWKSTLPTDSAKITIKELKVE